MGNKKNDLTSKEAVAKSRQVYSGIATGKTKNVTAELNKTHGRGSK